MSWFQKVLNYLIMRTTINKVEREEEWPEYTDHEDFFEEEPTLYCASGIVLDSQNPYVILAGPYYNKPENVRGLCLEESYFNNKNKTNDWLFPIEDFTVPNNKEKFRKVLEEVHRHGINEGLVYIGCKGGYGRTGLAIACLLKMQNVDNPVQLVRHLYNKKAIETKNQEGFVETF